MFGWTLLILSIILANVSCDYKCICNYNVEKTVYAASLTTSKVLGYMYEFDCKPAAGDAGASGWFTVAFEHELGFVESDAQLQIQTCPGSIPDEDKLPPPPSTTLPSTLSSTVFKTNATTTTTSGTSTFPTTSFNKTSQAVTTKFVPITQSTRITYNVTSSIIPSSTQNVTSSTVSTRLTSLSKSTLSSSISSFKTSASTVSYMNITTSLATTSSTIGSSTQSTMKVTQPIVPSSTAERSSTVPSTTRKPTSRLTTLLISSTTQTPTTVSTTSTTPSTSHVPSTTTTAVISTGGHTKSCPSTVLSRAMKSQVTSLAQFRNKCYEVVQTKVSWVHAEINCLKSHSQLVDIRSQEEQDFLFHYLESIKSHTVWLGLHDRNNEEQFQWTSGVPVLYTNWKSHRQTWNHLKEDCVYMTSNGTWNDIYCGSDDLKYEQQKGFTHSYICQYATVIGPPIVG